MTLVDAVFHNGRADARRNMKFFQKPFDSLKTRFYIHATDGDDALRGRSHPVFASFSGSCLLAERLGRKRFGFFEGASLRREDTLFDN
jgi:hypothetical protein